MIEPWSRFILREVFETGRVELLVLLPKGNGKTTLFGLLAVFHLLVRRNANCFIGAADKEQASEMYRFASHFASHPDLRKLLLIRASTKEIRSRRDQGFIRVLASDDSKSGGKRQAFNPTLALIDELHAHENDNLYVAMRSGLFKNKGLMVTITTAGWDQEGSTLGTLRAQMLRLDEEGGTVKRGMTITRNAQPRKSKDGRLTICRTKTGNSVMVEWACRPDDDLADMRIVKLCNPASYVTIGSLLDALEAPGITPAQFARYRANVWSQPDDSVITEQSWDARNTGATIPDDAEVWLVVDAANKSDSAALTMLWRRDDGVIVPKSHVWAIASSKAGVPDPPAHTLVRGRRTIGQAVIRDRILEIDRSDRTVLGVIFDPMLFAESAELLEEEGLTMEEFPQSNERLCPASEAVYAAVHEGVIEHDGDPVLRAHVTAAAAKPIGERWRFSKARSRRCIDALMTLVFGLDQARHGPESFGAEW